MVLPVFLIEKFMCEPVSKYDKILWAMVVMETRSSESILGFDSQAPEGTIDQDNTFWRFEINIMKTPDQLYKFNVANLREIDLAIDKIGFSLKKSISKQEEILVSTYTKLSAFLLGAWAECRLRKLIL